ncbi:MAG: cytotoxic translational repressor of toxin-antitoxin stability system [Candidatus Latescibacteria bacterium]|nr:cytotoxic translational repressor of toxin-antitoxin stability system [Candidatus Latescibacterota bacterium]
MWTVKVPKRVAKQIEGLPAVVQKRLRRLVSQIEQFGPVRGDWPNYSALTGNCHHCHLKKGHPTYVAVWQVADKSIRLVEVVYVGTHEKAPY